MTNLVCFFAIMLFPCTTETFAQSTRGNMPQQSLPTISVGDLKEKLASGDSAKLVLLDVREPDEHAVRHIPNSMLIPLGSLPQRIGELETFKGKEVIVYCRSGRRSAKACEFLMQQNFKVKNLDGGILAW